MTNLPKITDLDVSAETEKSVYVSPNDFSLEKLKAIIFKIPDNNESKIEFIKEELLAGRYQVRSEQIADKLLDQHALETVDFV